MLKKRLCDISNTDSTQTLESYIRDLENICSTEPANLYNLTEKQILDYIDVLYVICLTIAS